MINRVDTAGQPFRIGVHNEVQLQLCRAPVAEIQHGAEIPARCNVKAGKGQPAGGEGLHGKMKNDGTVLADGIEQHRIAEARRRFPKNPDRLGFTKVGRTKKRRIDFEWVGAVQWSETLYDGGTGAP